MKLKYVLSTFLILLLPVIAFADLDITVESNRGWGEARTSNIQRLCENIALHFQEQLRDVHKIDGRLTIVYRSSGPRAFYRSSFGGDADEYKIGLSVTDRYWDNFSYQFGHEFCHLMQNHDALHEELPNNLNKWFYEAICELANLWVIRRMSETWAYRPPYDNWVGYRHHLKDYANNWMMSRPEVQYVDTAADWLEEWEERMRRNESGAFTYARVAQLSYKFLPIFEENPKAWNIVRQMPLSNAKMSAYMQDWYDKVDLEDKQYVEAIAKIMDIAITPAIESETDTFIEYTTLTFTYENDDSIIPVNAPAEWDGWSQGVWEKTPDGTVGEKPVDYLEFDEMETLSNWIYSHAPSEISYDISQRNYTSFSTYFMIPHSSCRAASMKFTALADNIEIYTKSLYLSDYGIYVEFDIPANTRIFSVSIDDLGNKSCDHYVLGEPRLYYDNAKSVLPTVSLLPASVPSPNIGQQLNLSLKITNGESVAGYQATVQFDDTALRYVESRNSDYLPDGAFFVPPILEGNLVKLNAASVAGESNSDGTLAMLTFEVIAVKASTLTLSDVLLSNSIGKTFAPQIENAEITEPTKLKGDVNGDGEVNIADLVLVASNLGQTGSNAADVNRDGVVNIADLVLVAGALGTSASAPSLHLQALEMFTATDVKQWLSAAQRLNLTDMNSQRGILFLQQLFVALTPKETALLPNYPNPFNPETWIPYHLAKSADVTLHIYAMNGALVQTLTLGHQPAGKYQNRSRAAYWDGKNAFGEPVASGVYFYTLTAADFTATRKMLIQK